MACNRNGRASLPGFRPVPKTGVIYVTAKAAEAGFYDQPEAWANLGQGSPEAGPLPGAPQRVENITLDTNVNEYAPVPGIWDLRQAVADLYNDLFRQGKASQYTAENVCISGGGRLGLTRLAAALGEVNMGHFLPDYTAYEELLTIFKAFTPIPILLDPADGYAISSQDLEAEIRGRGLRALLISNPCNPTGQHVRGDELRNWVQIAREAECTCIFDEFYSHFVYDYEDAATDNIVSAAQYVDDVDRDPVIIVDGLTKNWRYPGWRISWTVGPKEVIETVSSAASFLDGGAPHPLQRAAVSLLDPAEVRAETRALQAVFTQKRDYMLGRLAKMDIEVAAEPKGSFYCWADLRHLPAPLNDGLEFFEHGLQERVTTVPGIFFDVNPGKRRSSARYNSFSRISFGPAMPALERGLDALERVIASAK